MQEAGAACELEVPRACRAGERVIETSAVICVLTSVALLGVLFCFQLGTDVEILLKSQDSQ